jgi:hypothetical protein
MSKKQNNKIYIPELQIYLDRESFFISCIYSDKKENREIRRRNVNISGIFRLKLNRIWVYEKELLTKYYFTYGDKGSSCTASNFNRDELAQTWNRIMKEVVKNETKPKKTKKK